jgi:sialate O-acetylesterase
MYDRPLELSGLNHSDLYNAMIHPFTHMVIYGAIWYQGKQMKCNPSFKTIFNTGEANTVGENRDKYPCTFSKMIEYWRQIWNQRTNGITDKQFPFGFVQVSLIKERSEFY